MVKYTNFYETVKEADMRLRYTLVIYEGEPYYVLLIADHKKDGIFRIYLDKMTPEGFAHQHIYVPYCKHEHTASDAKEMDDWLEKKPNSGVIRKMMNSPGFNQFRPFPLGMTNKDGKVVYVQRRPVRHTHQGLTDSALVLRPITLLTSTTQNSKKGPFSVTHMSVTDKALYNTIMGIYPTPASCIENLRQPQNDNEAVAFNRDFAFVKGPIGDIYLAYKTDIIGFLPKNDLSWLALARDYRYTKEVVEDLRLFEKIDIR